MKALLSLRAGGPETLELTELADLCPRPGEISVDVQACAINYPDVLIIEDKYQYRPPRPFAPGAEIAGVVRAVGNGVDAWSVGDPLIALVKQGGLAEQAIVAQDSAIALPFGTDPVAASALMLAYGTSLHALVDRGQLKAKETLLVLGAAGGVGLAAIEIGKAIGARVVAAVSNEEKATAARAFGADETMIYDRGPFDSEAKKALAQAFKDIVGPQGADVIFDPVGGDYAESALRSIQWQGRYLVIGFPAGIPSLPLNLTLLKSCDIRGVFWGAFVERNPAQHRRNVLQILQWWSEGKIRPRIDRVYPLAEGGAAIARLASREAIGKVIVTTGQ